MRIGNTAVTYAGVQVAWSITSDKRLKSDITKSKLGLDFIKTLNPVSYIRNNDESNRTEYGFLAQEIEDALLKAGASNSGIITKDDDGMYSVRYNDFIAPLVKSVQEQQSIIESQQSLIEKQNSNIGLLQKAIENLSQQNSELLTKIEKIENTINK